MQDVVIAEAATRMFYCEVLYPNFSRIYFGTSDNPPRPPRLSLSLSLCGRNAPIRRRTMIATRVANLHVFHIRSGLSLRSRRGVLRCQTHGV